MSLKGKVARIGQTMLKDKFGCGHNVDDMV